MQVIRESPNLVRITHRTRAEDGSEPKNLPGLTSVPVSFRIEGYPFRTISPSRLNYGAQAIIG
jgi:hypothetical protein